MSISSWFSKHKVAPGEALGPVKNYPRRNFGSINEPNVQYNFKDGECRGYTTHPGLYRSKKRNKEFTPERHIKRRRGPQPKSPTGQRKKQDWSYPVREEPIPDFGRYGREPEFSSNVSASFNLHLQQILAESTKGGQERSRMGWNWSRVYYYRNVRPKGLTYGEAYYDYLIFINRRPDIALPSSTPEIRSIKDRDFLESRRFNNFIYDATGKLYYFAIPPVLLGKVPIVIYISEEVMDKHYLLKMEYAERLKFIKDSCYDYILWVLRNSLASAEFNILPGMDLEISIPKDE